MALIKGKQIESLNASKVIETSDKKFVAQTDIDKWNSNSDLVDLSNYYTKDETYNREEVDTLIANVEAVDPNSHNHDNKVVIDSLGDSANMLTYKGKVVVNDNEYSLRTLPIKKPKSKRTNERSRLPWQI